MTYALARQLMKQNNYFGAMMVEMGDADGLLSGISQSYPETIRPAIQVIGVKPGSRLAGIYMMIFKKRVLWFADTTVNIDPTAEELADIAIQTAEVARSFIARGAARGDAFVLELRLEQSSERRESARSRRDRQDAACRISTIDGEMQADSAVSRRFRKRASRSTWSPGDANILIFPDLQSGNIAYKLMARLGNAEAIGPILVGLNKPVFVLQQDSDVNDVVNMAAITAMEIQLRKKGEARVST